MQILIVTFQLNGMSHEQYVALYDEVAPVFAAVPGLLEKTWLANPGTNTYGGVYQFVDEASVNAYLAGDVFALLKANPGFTNVQAQRFDTFAAASYISLPGLSRAA